MSAQAENFQSECVLELLKNRKDFVRLRTGKRFSTKHFTVQSGSSDTGSAPDTCRVGFTVTTKVGNAVERNRIKRRRRSIAQEVFPVCGKPGQDYALIAKRKCLTGSHDAIIKDLKQALDHLHVNRAKGSKRLGKNPNTNR